MMEHHDFDLISENPLADYSEEELKKMKLIAKLLVDQGLLWTKHNDDQLPVLVAGIAKHNESNSIQKMTNELIAMLRSSWRQRVKTIPTKHDSIAISLDSHKAEMNQDLLVQR
jgi:hypothetical protein